MTQPPAGEPVHVHSRDNPVVKLLRRLNEHNTAYRKSRQYWVEGEHLCRAALGHGVAPAVAVFAESAWTGQSGNWPLQNARTVVLPDALFRECSALESVAGMGFVIDLPADMVPEAGLAAVVLDRVQDAGNVGSILRSAAAFGFGQVLAIRGSAALWSSKVVRAGMGAHFGLHLVEGLQPEQLAVLGLPLLGTSSHQGQWLHTQALPWPCAWVFGHEGQGVGELLAPRISSWLRITQPGGQESLNVAAAAAICLHASAISRLSRP